MEVFDQLADLHQATTDAFCELANTSIDSTGVFRVALSGGSTPKRIYEMIAERDLCWDRIHWFWGDERNVPLDHSDSNARMVHEALLDRVDIPITNIHEVPVNVTAPAEAARQYELTLREHFGDVGFPTWDLALMGMGDDAHTASLFPETAALREQKRWFVENWVGKFDGYRYTLTAPAINSARQIWFMVAGAGKREALATVISGQKNAQLYPSQLIQATRWLVTRDAAGP
ncbi:MAG: 6-phosphogluconolactonase [Rubripirellula sp.]|nr:6-phosphogluconolactonase [Rubripirellula sp.]